MLLKSLWERPWRLKKFFGWPIKLKRDLLRLSSKQKGATTSDENHERSAAERKRMQEVRSRNGDAHPGHHTTSITKLGVSDDLSANKLT